MEVSQLLRTGSSPFSSREPHSHEAKKTSYKRHPIIPDCLEHVLKFLSTADKGRSAQVCRLWKETCDRRSVWSGSTASVRLECNVRAENTLHSIHRRGIRKLRVRSHNNNLDQITRIFQTLQLLDVGGCYYTTDDCLVKAFQVPQQMSELKELRLAYCASVTDASIVTTLEKCPNIESLNLQGCTGIRLADPKVRECFRNCAKLRVLTVQGCKWLNAKSFVTLFPPTGTGAEKGDGMDGGQEGGEPSDLRELSLRDCNSISDDCLQCLCPRLTRLESLDLSFCISVSDLSLMAVANSLHQLQHLYLQAVDHVSSHGIKLVAVRCTKLKTLDLGFCEWMSNGCLDALSNSPLSDSLEHLDVSCANITDEGILGLCQSLHRLKHLKIGQCGRLTNSSLLHISTHLNRLVTVDVYGCGFSSSAINSMQDILPDLVFVNNNVLPPDRTQ